jgi:hypothetical protein
MLFLCLNPRSTCVKLVDVMIFFSLSFAIESTCTYCFGVRVVPEVRLKAYRWITPQVFEIIDTIADMDVTHLWMLHPADNMKLLNIPQQLCTILK